MFQEGCSPLAADGSTENEATCNPTHRLHTNNGRVGLEDFDTSTRYYLEALRVTLTISEMGFTFFPQCL